MKVKLTLQEKLRDLRAENRFKLSDVAEKTGISTTALSTYENDELKEIPHTSIVALAKLYGVSADYLLGMSENRKPNTSFSGLDLPDKLAGFLKKKNVNLLLLTEFVSHPSFPSLMADMELFVDGLERINIQILNALADKANELIRQKYGFEPNLADSGEIIPPLRHIEDDAYFFNRIGSKLNEIVRDIRNAHTSDGETASDDYLSDLIDKNMENIQKLWSKAKDDPRKRAADYLFYIICQDLQVKPASLTIEEKAAIAKLIARSGLYKTESKRMRRTRRHKKKLS